MKAMLEPSPQNPPKPPVTWEQAVAQFKRHNPSHPPGMPASKPSAMRKAALGKILERLKQPTEDRLPDGGKVERAEK